MRKRNLFDLSNEVKLTCDPGQLIPLDWWHSKPGDSFQMTSALLIRSTPLLAPILHTMIARLHYFFVPYRLIWDDYEDFFTGGADGLQTPTHPIFQLASVSESSLHNYLGLPVATYGATLNVNALPARAYSLIWNEHYRDQDLATLRTIDTTSGADTTTDVTVAKVAWPKDYLTTARGWQQKGTAVSIPLTGDADVNVHAADILAQDTTQPSSAVDLFDGGAVTAANFRGMQVVTGGSTPYKIGEADLSAVTGVDITDLRENIALQKFMEDMARGGSRYGEYLRMHLGIRSSDSRLQIPEYLGGGKQVLAFSEVLSTDGSNTGDLKGHGIGAMRSNTFRRFFEEHGCVMACMSIVPKPVYMDGIPKKWWKAVKEDYHQHQLEDIGEEEIYNAEVYAAHGTPYGTFGYQARYDDLRSQDSRICGELNSTLNHWHLARDFGSAPSLNETFIECTPTNRCWASTGTHKFIVGAYNKVAARRILSRRATTKIL